jgi:hypothetical protein
MIADPVKPFGIVAPETTVTPFTVTSTALPFQPSPKSQSYLKYGYIHSLLE